MNYYVALTLGLACAGIGGELLVRGSVGLARLARVSPGIVAVTFAAFATSSPELSVSISSAVAGNPQIALGDALGSNVVNVSLILALALVVSGIQSSRGSVRRDLPVALLVPITTGVLLLDGQLSRLDGFLLLGIFIAWLVAAVVEARRQRSAAQEAPGERQAWLMALSAAAGLALLFTGGSLVVGGAGGIAASFGIDAFVIGATIVAVGTSIPELAITVIAKLRGHGEFGLGTVLGSNIYNGAFIIAVAAVIHPISVTWREAATPLLFGLAALGITFPTRDGFIGRRRGVLLLALYAVYLAAILLFRSA